MTKEEYYMMRRKKKIRLHEMTNYVGCTVSMLSKYETDKAIMSDFKIEKYKEFIANYPILN